MVNIGSKYEFRARKIWFKADCLTDRERLLLFNLQVDIEIKLSKKRNE